MAGRRGASSHLRTGNNDPFAFTDSKMEVAFVGYLAKRSQLSSTVLRVMRWLCCCAISAHFLSGSQSSGDRQAGQSTQAVVVAAVWAVCTLEDFQLWLFLRDPQMPLAAHEARKCRNILVYAAARMIMCTGVDLALGPVSSAPANAALSALDMVSDNLRLTVGLRMLGLSCLCCCFTLANRVMSSHTALRDAVLGIAGVCILGFLLPTTALAWQELRCRCDFIGLHRPAAARSALPPLWRAAASHIYGESYLQGKSLNPSRSAAKAACSSTNRVAACGSTSHVSC